MKTFRSEIQALGVVAFPTFANTRIMMMPVRMGDPESLPEDLSPWRDLFVALCNMGHLPNGIGYLTIDELRVPKGRTHRRPGIHVDGIGEDGSAGGWGGGGGGYGKSGMVLAASHVGCRAYKQSFVGRPAANGCCAHLATQCQEETEVTLQPGFA